jgi:hypothetical protein
MPTIWGFHSFQSRDVGNPRRVAFISIGTIGDDVEELDFQPKEVASDVIFSNSQFYKQRRSWTARPLCLEHSDTVVYPVSVFVFALEVLLISVDC